MIITLLNQKGGVGKTTVALLLGGILKHAGYDVAIDDHDPQGSATFFAPLIDLPLLKQNPTAAYIIADTPGHLRVEGELERQISDLISASDIVILVTEKSPASVHGSAPMARLIQAKKSAKAKAYVLFNKVRAGTAIGQQNSQEIASDLGIPALTNQLPLSAAFENAFVSGFASITGKHRTELLNLALEIMK